MRITAKICTQLFMTPADVAWLLFFLSIFNIHLLYVSIISINTVRKISLLIFRKIRRSDYRCVNPYLFYFIYSFHLYIYLSDSPTSDAMHGASNYPHLLPEKPRYCCPLETFYFDFLIL